MFIKKKPKVLEKIKNSKLVQGISNHATYYKRGILIALAVCMLITFGVSLASTLYVYCDEGVRCTWQEIQSETGQAVEEGHSHALTKLLLDWCDNVFGTDGINEIRRILYVEFGGDNAKILISLITGGTKEMSIDLSIVSKIYDTFKLLGIALMIVYLGIGLLEDISFNQMFAEKLIRKGIFFVIALVVILNANTIIYGTANLGTALVDKIAAQALGADNGTNPASSGNDSLDTIKTLMANMTTNADLVTGNHPFKKLGAQAGDVVGALGCVLMMFIPWIFNLICMTMIKVKCWSRFFEIIITATVAPLGFADIAKGQLGNSNAMRVFKNVIALSLSGAIIILVYFLTNSVKTTLLAGGISDMKTLGSALWNAVLISVVQLGLIQRSTDITKQAMGMS